MALPRPVTSEYLHGRGLFRKGHSSSVETAIVAAVRNLTKEPRRYAEVRIYNGRSIERATVVQHGVHIRIKRHSKAV